MAKGLVFGGLNSTAGSKIKSIQRGAQAFAVADTSKNVTIGNVDIAKSVAILKVNLSPTSFAAEFYFTENLSSATNLTISRQLGANSNPTVYWEVVEFDSSVSIQKGTKSIPTSTAFVDVPISTVNLNKVLVFVSFSVSSASGSPSTVTYELTSPTNLRLRVGSNPFGTYSVRWAIVEL
jgi:hypothetical protein